MPINSKTPDYGDSFDFESRIKEINSVKMDDVNQVINEVFNVDNISVATVGSIDKPIA